MAKGWNFVCNRRDKQGLVDLCGGLCVVGDYGNLGVKRICYLLCVYALGTSKVLMVKREITEWLFRF